ncbi:MAG: hypothetical protein LBV67_07275, partial [Streptococcaceae bacterium]|nr:hypothetical protein [Streptococcaceae bacterium]
DLAKQLKQAMKKAELEETTNLSFTGSVLVKNEKVLRTVLREIEQVNLQRKQVEPTKASFYYNWKSGD